MDLNNKVCIITGASSGIGASIAIALAGQRAKITIVGRNVEKLNKIAKICENKGAKPLVIQADVSDDKDAKKIIDKTIEHFGKLDVLINNAGILARTSIDADDAVATFDQIFNTNARAVVVLTSFAVKYLIKSKGNIINISSVSAIKVPRKGWAYGMSKSAVDTFSRGMALDLAGKGIRVNTINPGPVKTDILQNMVKNEGGILSASWDQLRSLTALNEVIEPEEIANLVLYLASDKAKSVTGSSFICDGGYLLK